MNYCYDECYRPILTSGKCPFMYLSVSELLPTPPLPITQIVNFLFDWRRDPSVLSSIPRLLAKRLGVAHYNNSGVYS